MPLAGWWQRAWATIIDSLILGLATVGAALPFIDDFVAGHTLATFHELSEVIDRA